MSKAPPANDRKRMIMRVLVVFLGLLAFRAAGDDQVGAGLLLWAGIICVGFPSVDWLTLPHRDRSSMLPVGTFILGLGLVAAGTLQL